jgi:excisionase family DNA binding protein
MFTSMSNTDNHIFITKKEVAELLRCSIGTIDGYMRKGYIHTYGYGRRVLFNKEEVINGLIKR